MANTYALIDALTNFLTPLIQGRTAGRYADTYQNEAMHEEKTQPTETPSFVCAREANVSYASSPTALTEEAAQLVDALRKFVKTLSCCHLDRDQLEGTGNADIRDRFGHMNEERGNVINSVSPQSQRDQVHGGISVPGRQALDDHKRSFLEESLKEARHVVFNRMPIRMLTFNGEGTDISLVGRSEVYRLISSQIEQDVCTLDLSLDSELICDRETYPQKISKFVTDHARYAILSHTWNQGTSGELTYIDWQTKIYSRQSVQFAKLANFCRVAATQFEMKFAWMDTMCINKDSSSELDESIRSMYKWYQGSEVCIVYLAETSALGEMHGDSWFTRGWTLQELIAPRRVKFYARDWTVLGSPQTVNDKVDREILAQIYQATSIIADELVPKPLKRIPISRRMQWAATRRVTREEDIAYSLMGIFDVSIATAYGEGSDRAFLRLVHEILSIPDEHVIDIINWGQGPSNLPASRMSTLIPTSPQAYAFRSMAKIKWDHNLSPVTLTRVGLSVSILLMPVLYEEQYPESIIDEEFTPQGNFYASVVIANDNSVSRSNGTYYKVLDSRALNQLAMERNKGEVFTSHRRPTVFGMLNFLEERTIVVLPEYTACLAIRLDFHRNHISSSSLFSRTLTKQPITFKLRTTNPEAKMMYTVPKSQLYNHGMVVRKLYL